MAWGTLEVSDALATLVNAGNMNLASLNLEDVWAIVQRDLNYHAALVNEFRSDLCIVTDKMELPYGVIDDVEAEDFDEYGKPDVKKGGYVTMLGFPLGHTGVSAGWTSDYLDTVEAGEFAQQLTSFKNADLKSIKIKVLRAMFTPTNNLTYYDALLFKRLLRLRAFYNADGEAVMPGPQGQTFDPTTHTHYMGASSYTGAALTSLYLNVLEHGNVGDLVLYVALADVPTIKGFTGSDQFTPVLDLNLVQPLTATYVRGVSLDQTDPTDRHIGQYGAAQVWIKPWMPSGYAVCVDKGNGKYKPLVWRTRPGALKADFGLRGSSYNSLLPLNAETLARDYGIGVGQRHMGAILDTTHSGTYTYPGF